MNTKFLASFIVAFVFAGGAKGTILFTSLDPATTSDSGGGSTDAQFAAVAFVPTVSGDLTDIIVDVFSNPATTAPTTWTFTLYTNGSSNPGTVLESWTATPPPVGSFNTSDPNSIDTTFDAVDNIVLNAGTEYWFVIDATNHSNTNGTPDIGWAGNGAGEPLGGIWVGNAFNNLSQANAGNPLGAIEVDGTPLPEPATLALLGLGALALAVRRYRPAR